MMKKNIYKTISHRQTHSRWWEFSILWLDIRREHDHVLHFCHDGHNFVHRKMNESSWKSMNDIKLPFANKQVHENNQTIRVSFLALYVCETQMEIFLAILVLWHWKVLNYWK